jgi:hypothetical protein
VAGKPRRGPRPLAWLDDFDEYAQLCRVRLQTLVRVREPLVVVSEVPRSGGTLLSQLFDGHPECHAHPTELKIGGRKTWRWPALDLAAPEKWFETLFEKKAATHFLRGYDKSLDRQHEYDVFPFVFLPKLQRLIFEQCVAERPVETERDLLDGYFTSYFNAWLDNQNLYGGPKKVVTAFWPRFIVEEQNVEGLFRAYPDGTLISIVRDPRGWYRSASLWLPKYRDRLGLAIEMWRRSTEAALAASERYGDRVLILSFEDLLREPEATMTLVAARVGISMSPTLLAPTFNGRPIRANSSEPVRRYGVLPDRAERWREDLDPRTVATIEEATGDLYERARAHALQPV